MQTIASEAFDLSNETAAMQTLYGLNDATTVDYGQQCLLARRLVERGVRCVVVNHRDWDQHSDLIAGHEKNARAVDRPIAGLLTDLKQRGLLEETLVIWGGEFGRTPATDDLGYEAVEGRVHIHDWHATILHLLGLDHERLTYRHGGRDQRLTDVKGSVVRGILA